MVEVVTVSSARVLEGSEGGAGRLLMYTRFVGGEAAGGADGIGRQSRGAPFGRRAPPATLRPASIVLNTAVATVGSASLRVLLYSTSALPDALASTSVRGGYRHGG